LKKLNLLIAVALLALGLNAFADEAKIAYVDGARVIQKYEPIIDAKLQDEFKKDQDIIVALQKALLEQSEKFNRDAAVMSDEEVDQMQKQFEKDQAEFQRLNAEYNQKRAQAGSKELEKLIADLENAAEKIAKKEGYTVVMQKGVVIYTQDKKADITDEVMSNIKYK
jgi:outer membrane protein